MKVLITGDQGFIGKATAKTMAGPSCGSEFGGDHKVVGFDLLSGDDVRDIAQIKEAVKKYEPDRILHLAAVARFAEADADPVRAFETNAVGTLNVARVAGEYHIPVVYASTGSVYMPITQEPPITEDFRVSGNSVYACSKTLGEHYIRRYCTYIILRYAHIYGPEKRHHGLIGGFLDRINRGLAPVLYGGSQSNDFTYIDDIVSANIKALTASADAWHQTYNIGTGEELSAYHAGRMVCDVFGYDCDIEAKVARTVDPPRFVYDISKAENMLGYRPQYDFRSGLEKMRDLSSGEERTAGLHDGHGVRDPRSGVDREQSGNGRSREDSGICLHPAGGDN